MAGTWSPGLSNFHGRFSFHLCCGSSRVTRTASSDRGSATSIPQDDQVLLHGSRFFGLLRYLHPLQFPFDVFAILHSEETVRMMRLPRTTAGVASTISPRVFLPRSLYSGPA